MRRIVLAVLAMAALLPLNLNAKDDARTGLTVMSYNIRQASAQDGTNSWQYRYAASAMMIDELKPDVLGMQEVEYSVFGYLKDVFLKSYKIIGVGREDGKKKGEMMAVMYNSKTISLLKWGTFWLSETPDVPSLGWDGACHRCATWAILKDKDSGKKFFLVDTHIDHEGQEAQKKGIETLMGKISELNSENLPVVLMGDFNMEANNAALEPVKSSMKDARRTAVVSDDHHTYNGWGKAHDSIDFIWYKGFGSCIEYQTVTRAFMDRNFISDHFPIKAVLMF